jgi:hypothetical protein
MPVPDVINCTLDVSVPLVDAIKRTVLVPICHPVAMV